MRKRVAGLLAYIDLVRREFDASVFHARALGQVQPLARALINGMTGRGMHLRLRLRAGLGPRPLDQHNMAVEHS